MPPHSLPWYTSYNTVMMRFIKAETFYACRPLQNLWVLLAYDQQQSLCGTLTIYSFSVPCWLNYLGANISHHAISSLNVNMASLGKMDTVMETTVPLSHQASLKSHYCLVLPNIHRVKTSLIYTSWVEKLFLASGYIFNGLQLLAYSSTQRTFSENKWKGCSLSLHLQRIRFQIRAEMRTIL